MARPRTIADAEILELARSCIVENGPGVSLSTIAKAVGLSAPALVKRFGSKERLLFRALLPTRPPRWTQALATSPGDDAQRVLAGVLEDLCAEFSEVGPALAALRMSSVDTSEVFPSAAPGPPVLARRQLATWLAQAGVPHAVAPLADAAVGAAEARGLLSWVGPQMVDSRSTAQWAADLSAVLLAHQES